jgi:hypothetical protein
VPHLATAKVSIRLRIVAHSGIGARDQPGPSPSSVQSQTEKLPG